jgi:DNA-binding transcriptional LysR family regulator
VACPREGHPTLRHAWIGRRSPPRSCRGAAASANEIDAWLDEQGARPEVYAEVDGNEAILAMVALGCGAGVAPSAAASNRSKRGGRCALSSGASLEREWRLAARTALLHRARPVAEALGVRLPMRTINRTCARQTTRRWPRPPPARATRRLHHPRRRSRKTASNGARKAAWS